MYSRFLWSVQTRKGTAQETFQLFAIGGRGPLRNSTDLRGIHLNVALRDDEPQECDGGNMKLTFLCFGKELVIEEALKNLADMLDVSLFIRGENEDVIQVNKQTGLACHGEHH